MLMGIVLIIFTLGMLAIASATDVVNVGITRQVQMQAFSFLIGLAIIVLVQFVNYEVFNIVK